MAITLLVWHLLHLCGGSDSHSISPVELVTGTPQMLKRIRWVNEPRFSREREIYFSQFLRLAVRVQGASMVGFWRVYLSGVDGCFLSVSSYGGERVSSLVSYKDTSPISATLYDLI